MCICKTICHSTPVCESRLTFSWHFNAFFFIFFFNKFCAIVLTLYCQLEAWPSHYNMFRPSRTLKAHCIMRRPVHLRKNLRLLGVPYDLKNTVNKKNNFCIFWSCSWTEWDTSQCDVSLITLLTFIHLQLRWRSNMWVWHHYHFLRFRFDQTKMNYWITTDENKEWKINRCS